MGGVGCGVGLWVVGTWGCTILWCCLLSRYRSMRMLLELPLLLALLLLELQLWLELLLLLLELLRLPNRELIALHTCAQLELPTVPKT